MPDDDHFVRLGLPRRFALDTAELERRYLAASRDAHPDHVGDTAESLDRSARINEAYVVLKDDFRRAEYLMKLAGGPAASAVTKPPAEFLEEMLELRMAIEEVRDDPEALAQLADQLTKRRQAMLGEIGGQLDAGAADLTAIRERLNAAKFINGLLRDLNEE